MGKEVKGLLFGGMMSLLLLGSCLDEGKNEQSRSGVPGIIRLDTISEKWLIDAPDFLPYGFYAPGLGSLGLEEGSCLLFSYTLDFNSAENKDYQKTGIFEGTVSNLSSVEKFPCVAALVDTTKVMENEKPVASAIDPSYGCYYFGRTLFLFSQYAYLSGEETEWHLYYTPFLEASEEDGQRIYSLFVRATVREEGKAPSATGMVVNAFDAGEFFDKVGELERAAGSTEAYIRFYYVSEITDSTFVWTSYTPIPYAIPEE